jgi:hypothetical protein
MSVQIDTAHRRHIDVSDQAGSFDERMEARKLAADEKSSTL